MDKYVLGVDLGGTKIAVLGSDKIPEELEVSLDQDVKQKLEKGIMRVPSGMNDFSKPIEEKLLDAVIKYVEQYENGIMPSAIGFGLKDYVDRKHGIWYSHLTESGFQPLDFADYIYQKTGVPVVIDNDVHTAAEGELVYGAGRKYRDFLYINIGTGISMGAVIDGRILKGASNYAGEIGHMSVETDGENCSFCAQRGCYEEIASGKAIILQAQKAIQMHPDSLLAKKYKTSLSITSRDVFQAADEGDETAMKIANRVYKAVLTSTCGLINVFNPEAVIFGGGVMSDGWIVNKLKEDVPSLIIRTNKEALQEISLSPVGSDHIGVLGAVVLAEKGGF